MKPVLFDVMDGDDFICQIRYPKRGFPTIIQGKETETYDYEEVKKYVLEKRPSLKNRNIHLLPSEQMIYAN